MNPEPRINNVEDVKSDAATMGTLPSADKQVNQLDNLPRKHKIYNENYDSDYDEIEDNYVAIITDDHNFRDV